jgi:hypothetical protein
MTTKILTVRVPAPIYSAICCQAGEMGIPVSAYVRQLVQQEHQATQIKELRRELLSRLDALSAPSAATASPAKDELLLLVRAIATHLNAQLVAQVHARLAN